MSDETTRFGHYALLRLLGRGGMGAVYLAYDERRSREVALKLLPDALAADPEYRQRFQREARLAAHLQDPHVVPIHDFGEIDGRLFIDMRLVRGRDLRKVIEEDGPLSPDRAVAIIEQAGQAIDAAHADGLVHRDVKPGNILVTDRDFAYLTDFGIASRSEDTRLTRAGHTIGSFTYMAPERFDPSMSPDERVDIYALGCVLYEALTGLAPFPGDSVTALMGAHLTAPRPQPSSQRPELPAALDGVVETAMAINPDERFTSAAALSLAAQSAIAIDRRRTDLSVVSDPLPTEPVDAARSSRHIGAENAESLAGRTTAAALPISRTAAQGDGVVAPGATPPGPQSSRKRRAAPILLAALLIVICAVGAAALLDRPDRTKAASNTLPSQPPATTPTGGAPSAVKSAAAAGSASTRSAIAQSAEPTASATPETAAEPSPTPASSQPEPNRPTPGRVVRVPAGATYCPPRSDIGGLRAYVAENEVADPCAWALNVAQAVRANGNQADAQMAVYSPARGRTATVTCQVTSPIRCKSDRTATAWVIRPGEDVVQD